MKKLLMVDPNFPTSQRSVNHQNILPIGLLKIGAYYQSLGWDVRLQRLSESQDLIVGFKPTKIIITSLFTYWSEYVKEAVDWAKEHYDAPIEVGGIFASLQPKLCKQVTGADSIFIGVMEEAEQFRPNYSLLSKEPDFQIVHTSRGCQRKCKPCGVYSIEPCQSFKSTIKDEIFKRKVVFYDNNLLANPHIENILRELVLLKRKRKILHCESQSGFDGRILREKPYLAKMIKESGFVYPKIAWDGSVKSWKNREKEIDILADVGYRRENISVFMLSNYEQIFDELEWKRMYCWNWGVQVNQCRFRPLNQLYDNFNGRRKGQTNDDYFIHPNWTDKEVKQFNRNVRRHNLSIRFRGKFYSKSVEHKIISKDLHDKLRYMKYSEALQHLDDVWNPQEFHYND